MRGQVVFSQRIDADAREFLCHFFDIFDPERGLYGVHLQLDRHIADIVEDIDRELLFDLALPDLVEQVRHLLRAFHPELGKAHDTHIDPGQVPVCPGDGVKEVPDHLRLVYLCSRSFTSCLNEGNSSVTNQLLKRFPVKQGFGRKKEAFKRDFDGNAAVLSDKWMTIVIPRTSPAAIKDKASRNNIIPAATI